MYLWFIFSILGMCLMVPLHFLSVEHLKFQKKFGMDKGNKITGILGLTSGWGFFIFWFGIWISPQPRLILPFLQDPILIIPIINFSIPLFHLIISIPFILIGAWFGIGSVRETSLKVAETHRTERIVSTKIYSLIRHPQYVGGIMAHIGISFLLSSLFSLIFTPIVILLNLLVAWKEEKELLKEFGKEYENYKEKVPMIFPKFKKRKLD
ncbi:MAG: isoprenylcysteine carboxylmethyltransferase family protein [Candidatus Lokiarchaeota archaeon]|nr:isoprenylcysteine carboxylmethyltransferase family protein [Candidatus Lokiarchaeota archaeon]